MTENPAENSIDPISRRIKAIRQQKKISQTDFAQLIGIERSNYHRLENRGSKLTLEQLQRIALALDVSIVQLVSDEAPAGLEQTRIIQRLESQLTDKQRLLDGYVGTNELVAGQIEMNLARTAQAVKLAQLDPAGGVAGSLIIVHQAGKSLADFPDRSEHCTLFDQSYTGLQLVYLALHMSVTEANFFSLLIRLVDLQLLDRDPLYVRAFLYVSQASTIYDGVLEEIMLARRDREGRIN